ncbi:MAG: hypothetical protein ACRENB_12275 [Gemmatimonadales bacterium]
MRSVRTRWSLALVLSLSAGSAGCVGWRTEQASPRELLSSGEPVRAVRVVRQNNDKVELFDPVLVGDSIRGGATERAIQRITVPLADIQSIQSRHTSFGRTVLMVLAIGGGVALYGVLQGLNQGY